MVTGSRESLALRPLVTAAGVPHDGALIVHAGISRLSRAGFRAELIIECLLDQLRDGTLLMPAMTWRTVTPQHPNWDELDTPSHTGVLGEIFRQRYATSRSLHPTHSVCAVGRDADFLVSRHHFDDTPVSANSPYGLLQNYNTYILMLGVGLESCTAIHLPEEQIAPDLYLRPPASTETYRCRDRWGTVHMVRTRRHWRLDRDFPKFAKPLMAKGQLLSGMIENCCSYQIVAMSHLLHEVTATLLRNIRGTLSDKPGSAPPSNWQDDE